MADPKQEATDVQGMLDDALRIDRGAVSALPKLGALRRQTMTAAADAEKADAIAALGAKLDAFEQSDLGKTQPGADAIAELRALIAAQQ